MLSSANTEAKTSLYDSSSEMVDLWGNVMLILGIGVKLQRTIEGWVTMSSISDKRLQVIELELKNIEKDRRNVKDLQKLCRLS